MKKIYTIQLNYSVRAKNKQQAIDFVSHAIKSDYENKGKYYPFPFCAKLSLIKTLKSQLEQIWKEANKKLDKN